MMHPAQLQAFPSFTSAVQTPPVPTAADPRGTVAVAAGAASSPQPPAGAGTFVRWALAMGALWFILTALSEYGGSAAKLAPYLAGLILFGVLYYRGPQALQNLQGVI